MSARNRELLGLIPASLLVTAGFAGVFIQRSNALSNVSLTYGAMFLGLCIAAHVFIRITLPRADPYMFPLVAVLASFGLVMIYRISPTLARQQAQWFVLGLILFAAHDPPASATTASSSATATSIVFISLGLLVLPRLPGIGYPANGAYLGVRIPGLFVFQPAEFAKIGLVIFLASYLRDTRQVLVQGGRRFLGITFPPIKHFGPVVVIWGLAMVTLVVLSDIGSSLMFYGGLLAMLYVATNRRLVRRDRPGRRGDRLLVPGHAHPPHPRPRGDVAASVQPAAVPRAAWQLPGRQLDVRAVRRRAVRAGLRAGGADDDQTAGRCCRPPRPT